MMSILKIDFFKHKLIKELLMNNLFRLTASLALAVIFGSVPLMAIAVSSEELSTSATSKGQQKASFLFVLRADVGVIAKTDGGGTLTLQGLDDKVMYFSDGSVKTANYIALTQFIGDWAKGDGIFRAYPTKEIVVHAALKLNDKSITEAIPLELTHPMVTKNGWIFQLKNLKPGISLSSHHGVTVFVDSIGPLSVDAYDTTVEEPEL
jgi:hypothetical protein